MLEDMPQAWTRRVPHEGTTEDLMHVALKAALEKTPIVSRRAWAKMQSDDERKATMEQFMSLAYVFVRGPWRYCYIQSGYDPRLDREAAMRQVTYIPHLVFSWSKKYL